MRRFLILLFLFFPLPLSFAQGLEDWYAAISQYAGIDPNAGLATFWTLVIPPGGMYEAMGTAYTAVVKDSGYIEANPAGSALLKDTELSVYHNDWIGDSRMEAVVYTIRNGDLGLGFGSKILYLPFTAINNWGDRYQNSWSSDFAKGYYTEYVGTLNASYNFFNSYYFSGLTLGANLKFAYRGVPTSIAQGQSAFDMMADFGALTRFNLLKFYPSLDRNFSVGLALKNLGPPVMGDPLPSEASFGIAYQPFRPLTLSFDTNIPFFLGVNLPPQEINFAVGMDLALTSFWAVQSGLDLVPGRPRFTVGTSFSIEKLVMNVNYTVDLMTSLAPFDRISIEAKLNLGDLGRQDAQNRSRDLYLNGLDAYARGNFQEAILDWEKSLEITPNFTPALNMIETTRRALELQKEMADKQKAQ
jgi:tetratricopeptide (TPR) repeat protein